MRAAVLLSLLVILPGGLTAQRPSVTLSAGVTTAWRGSGPSGAVRIEVPSIEVARDIRLLLGGGAWVAQTAIVGAPFELKRNLRGIGPSVGLGWRPGGSRWQLAVHGAMEAVHSGRQDIVVPQVPGATPVDIVETYGTTAAPVFSFRLSTPSGGGGALELGAVATRHGGGGSGWWSRFELGLRLGGGRG